MLLSSDFRREVKVEIVLLNWVMLTAIIRCPPPTFIDLRAFRRQFSTSYINDITKNAIDLFFFAHRMMLLTAMDNET